MTIETDTPMPAQETPDEPVTPDGEPDFLVQPGGSVQDVGDPSQVPAVETFCDRCGHGDTAHAIGGADGTGDRPCHVCTCVGFLVPGTLSRCECSHAWLDHDRAPGAAPCLEEGCECEGYRPGEVIDGEFVEEERQPGFGFETPRESVDGLPVLAHVISLTGQSEVDRVRHDDEEWWRKQKMGRSGTLIISYRVIGDGRKVVLEAGTPIGVDDIRKLKVIDLQLWERRGDPKLEELESALNALEDVIRYVDPETGEAKSMEDELAALAEVRAHVIAMKPVTVTD